jgi:acetyl-CoA C-acetyltransferase
MNSASSIPILVGVAQLEQRLADPAEAREPLDLMLDAVRAAAADAGATRLLSEATAVRVIRGAWRYADPGRAIARELGVPQAETALTQFGGNFVQSVVNQTALDIQAGRHEIAIITGAECSHSFFKARKAGIRHEWRDAPGTPDRIYGKDVPMNGDLESAVGLNKPIQFYPMFENALRHARGESIAEHRTRIAALWSRFSEVAAQNPHAWIREHQSAETIATPAASNRPVSFPYPKLMNSNNNVDQAAALIMCSTAVATRLGIAEEKWIYPWAGTDAHDHLLVSNRDNLYSSPAIRIAGNRCLELAGVAATDLDHVDLYSCFPVAVQVSAAELGLDEQRPLTVTGGLTFAGGPLNNYVMHSIATMVETLRANDHAKGLVTANGGYLTKHAFGVYSAIPPSQPYQHQDLQDEADRTPRREAVADYAGPIETEAYTVMYGADGPDTAYVAGLIPTGERVWASTTDPELLSAMTEEEFCGRPGRLDGNGTVKYG